MCPFEVISHSVDEIFYNSFPILRVYEEISLSLKHLQYMSFFYFILNDVISMYHNCTRIQCSYLQNCIIAYYMEKNLCIEVMQLDSTTCTLFETLIIDIRATVSHPNS